MNNLLLWTEADNPANESSVIRTIIFNAHNNEAYVVMHDGNTYRYSDVGRGAYQNFVKAESAGAHYNTHFKKAYGPAEHMGNYSDLSGRWTKNPYHALTAKALTYADDAVVDGVSLNEALTETNETNYFPLTVNTLDATALAVTTNSANIVTSPSRKHVVHFDVVGAAVNDRTYTTEAGSVNAAVAQVTSYAFALGVTIKVTKVEVYFE